MNPGKREPQASHPVVNVSPLGTFSLEVLPSCGNLGEKISDFDARPGRSPGGSAVDDRSGFEVDRKTLFAVSQPSEETHA